MPNHVRQYLTVVGTEGDVNRFVAAARGRIPRTGDKEGPNQCAEDKPEEPLSFHAIVPLPAKYGEVPYSSQGYEMECATWGVKWGAYDQVEPIIERDRVLYKFTCAWGPPTEWMRQASKTWPELRFFLSWGGEGPTRGRMQAHGGNVKIEEDKYRDYDYPRYEDFGKDEETASEAYSAAEKKRLYEHAPWVNRTVGHGAE